MATERIEQLTNRQREVLRLYRQRYRVKEIARTLQISENTVSGYLTEATTIVGAGGRSAAAAALAAYEADHPNARGRFSGDEPPPSTGSVPPRSAAPPTPIAADPRNRWGGLLGKRGNGNDLSIAERLAAVVGIAIVLATGFGFFAIFVRTVSDLVGFTRP